MLVTTGARSFGMTTTCIPFSSVKPSALNIFSGAAGTDDGPGATLSEDAWAEATEKTPKKKHRRESVKISLLRLRSLFRLQTRGFATGSIVLPSGMNPRQDPRSSSKPAHFHPDSAASASTCARIFANLRRPCGADQRGFPRARTAGLTRIPQNRRARGDPPPPAPAALARRGAEASA